MRVRPTNILYRVIAILLILCCITAVVGFATLSLGVVIGQEFSPDTFRRRTFLYYRLPLVGIQITPVFRDDVTNSLELHLKKNGLIPTSSAPSARWHLVYTVYSGSKRWHGDPAILCNYLDEGPNGQESPWMKWTKDHPEMAKTLWPVIATVARRNQYWMIPQILRLARQCDQPAALKDLLDDYVIGQYKRMGRRFINLGKKQDAIAMFDFAMAIDPDNPVVIELRESCVRNP